MASSLNFKHLRYFWMVAKSGSIARASEQLHLTPQSISGQLSELEEALGVKLFRRAGRGLELTDTGQRLLGYAEQIFTLGDELLESLNENALPQSVPSGSASPIRCPRWWPIDWSSLRSLVRSRSS